MPRHHWLFVALLCSALVLGLGFGRSPEAAGPCSSIIRSGSSDISMTSAGQQRQARMHVPSAPAGKQLPLVIAFHGAGATGEFMERYSGLSAVADKGQFVVVYPNASGSHPFWSLNDDARNGPQDVTFISDLLDQVEDSVCIDTRRVYGTGVSNGGGFTARIGCQLSGRFTAIAPVAGGYRAIPDCHATRPVSVLEIHGTADRAVPYWGKPPDYRGSVPRYLAGWRRIDHCGSKPVDQRMAAGTLRQVWAGCADGTRVEHIKRWGRGHEWPGAFDAPGMSAAQVVWDFFHNLRSVATPSP
jgi:polyhydroxybutyrate depolymerase